MEQFGPEQIATSVSENAADRYLHFSTTARN